MKDLIKIDLNKPVSSLKKRNAPYYYILIVEGDASFSIDFNEYNCTGKSLIFLSPYQLLQWHNSSDTLCTQLRFHGDFYCIEYHKKEVACNGILFNSIYHNPFISISEVVFEEIVTTVDKMNDLSHSDLDISIIKTYLQLILALSSKEKQLHESWNIEDVLTDDSINGFQTLLESSFLESREVAFYASKFGLTNETFSKKIKKHFGKPPTKLIQERVVLEAKKLLHLTYKPIKEIAMELCFEDEFYFSRYFKKEVGVSPKKFRDDVGISIVAKKSR